MAGAFFLGLASVCPQAVAGDSFPPTPSSAGGQGGGIPAAPLTISVTTTGEAGDLIPLKLGMSLAAFKTMADQQRVKYPTAHVMCSNDPDLHHSTALALMRPMPDEKQAGIIRCHIFRPDPVNVSWWAPILPAIDGKQIKSATYFFLPSGADYRLLFTEAVLPDQYLPSVRQQLTAAIGKPQTQETREEGSPTNQRLVTDIWKNASMSILIDSRTNSFQHDFVLTYVGTELAELAATHGFGHSHDALYYSAHQHYR
jgi:hypothetical protein